MSKTNERGWEKEFVEAGASLEHARWSKWQSYLHSLCDVDIHGNLVIPKESVERWERQMYTEYPELSEKEKESDRKEARTYLPLLRQLELDTIARCKEDIENKINEDIRRYVPMDESDRNDFEKGYFEAATDAIIVVKDFTILNKTI